MATSAVPSRLEARDRHALDAGRVERTPKVLAVERGERDVDLSPTGRGWDGGLGGSGGQAALSQVAVVRVGSVR